MMMIGRSSSFSAASPTTATTAHHQMLNSLRSRLVGLHRRRYGRQLSCQIIIISAFDRRATFSTQSIKVNIMPLFRTYSTPERLARIRASKRAWAQRNASYCRQKNKEYTQRPEYVEQRKRWYQNWKQKQLQNRGPPKRRGPPPTYACENDKANAHRMTSAKSMRRYRARLKELKRLAEASNESQIDQGSALDNAIDNALEVATTAAVVPDSVAAEADECVFCVGPDGGAGFLVYSQNGIVRQIQPVSEAGAFV